MIASLVIFIVVYVLIATELTSKSSAAFLGVLAVISLRLIDFDAAMARIDMNVILLLIGMMGCVALLAQTGFFEWVAMGIAKGMKGRPVPILVMLLSVTMLFSAFLDNVTTVILMAPVTILITQVLELPTAMFLILEALASNIGGTATLIGDPPNIILGSKVGLTFWDFFVHLTPTVILIGAAFVLTAWLVLRKRLRVPPQVQARVLKACPELAIIKPHMMRRSLLVFLFIFGLFFTHHLYHLPVGIVAIGGLGVMMLICRVNVDEMLKMVEWDAVLFFVGLFIVVGTMEHQGVLERAAELLVSVCGQNQLLAMLVILWGSALFSAVLDNIPFVIVMTPLVQNLVVDMGGAPDAPHPLYWALALGACLGGNATLIGASANVVVSKIGARNGYAITFMGFTRWGVLFTLESLVLATLCLWVRYYSGW